MNSDITREILLHLPAKSVLKFQSICKLFAALSSDPSFISAHTRRCRANPHKSVITVCAHSTLSIIHGVKRVEDEENNNLVQVHRTTHNDFHHSLQASFDGLLCFESSLKEFIISNPLTGEQARVKNPVEKHPHETIYVLGFYLNKNYNDYRLLLLKSNLKDYPQQLILLELGSKKIRLIDNEVYRLFWDNHAFCPVFMHGRLHWLGYMTSRREHEPYFLVIFDTRTEEFTCIPIPGLISPLVYQLVQIEGRLGICGRYVESPKTTFVLEDYGVWNRWIEKTVVVKEVGEGEVNAYVPISERYYEEGGIFYVKPEGNDAVDRRKPLILYRLGLGQLFSEFIQSFFYGDDGYEIDCCHRRYIETLAPVKL